MITKAYYSMTFARFLLDHWHLNADDLEDFLLSNTKQILEEPRERVKMYYLYLLMESLIIVPPSEPPKFRIDLPAGYTPPIKTESLPQFRPLPPIPVVERFDKRWFLADCEAHLPPHYSLPIFSAQVLKLLMSDDSGIFR